MIPVRSESWTRDGQTAHVDVNPDETVIVSYQLLAEMLADLGFTKGQSRPEESAR